MNSADLACWFHDWGGGLFRLREGFFICCSAHILDGDEVRLDWNWPRRGERSQAWTLEALSLAFALHGTCSSTHPRAADVRRQARKSCAVKAALDTGRPTTTTTRQRAAAKTGFPATTDAGDGNLSPASKPQQADGPNSSS